MNIIRITNRFCPPFLAMLLSASVTSSIIHMNNVLTGLTSQGQTRDLVSAELESCCLHRFQDTTTASVNPPTLEKPAGDPIAAADIWVRIRGGLAFPEADPDVVRPYIDKYMKHPHHIEQILQRGEPYLFYILNRLEQEGMPTELALLPVIESAFDPFATSPVGAAGIWQFMPATAADVGLDQDWWYDGRRDIVASTEAALAYLGQLNKDFGGDWYLTLAAYNAGSGRVRSAIRRNRDAGKTVDFWHLQLPAETQSYVPRLIALRMIVKNPRHYNISLPTLSNIRHFSTLEVRGQIELKVAARLAGIPLAELERLNPGYDRSITPPDKTNTLLVPSLVKYALRERIARLPQDQRIQSIQHRIRRGDNLSTIAQHYRTTTSLIRKVNHLKGSKIIAGDLLIVPAGEQEGSIGGSTHTAMM